MTLQPGCNIEKSKVAGGQWRLLALLLVLSLLLVAACGDDERRLQLGDRAPDFTATDQYGDTIRMADLEGGPVVLRFWSVDCKYCRADTPIFNDYYRQYKDQGLMIIYVSLNEDEEMVRRFIADLEIEFPVVIDYDGQIAEKYRIKLDPQAVFIDPEHRLEAAFLGGVGEAEMSRLLGDYLHRDTLDPADADSRAPEADTAMAAAAAGENGDTGNNGGELPPPVEELDRQVRCPVCGMFVANYPEWVSQLHLDGDEAHHFDGMKDLLAYYFDPAKFDGRTDAEVKAIWARDYYTLEWIEARQAYFVVGSSVHGPMGHEFIPLASREAAEAFKKDHQGEEILTFDEITVERVNSMRSGHQM